MSGNLRVVVSAAGLAVSVLAGAVAGAGPAMAQKSGGTLIIQHWDSPASMSIHEGGDIFGRCPDDGGVQQSCSVPTGQ